MAPPVPASPAGGPAAASKEILREVPCSRCLFQMSKWTSGVPPSCCDDESASSKCTYCKKNAKGCQSAVGPLKARGRALYAAIKASGGVVTPEVKRLQVSVSKLLQAAKNAKTMSEAKRQEARKEEENEQRERAILAWEAIAVQIAGFREDYQRAHPELNAVSDDEDGDAADDSDEDGA